jgi:ribosomal protein S18 acetylase RimI-like enzyme
MEYKVERANNLNPDLVVNCIVESEYSGSEILSYAAIFNITLNETRALIKEIVVQNINNQPWALDNFYFLLFNNQPVCGLCAWIEPFNGNGFDFVKSQVLAYMLKDKWLNSELNLRITAEISVVRLQGALQLEHLYTIPQFRNCGFMSKLIIELETRFKLLSNEMSQIILMGNNQNAYNLYSKLGYRLENKICSSNLEIFKFLPSNCKLSLIKKI